ncbi:MAG TPA: hypothetical protein PLS26_11350 [Bacteroidales bacterium]|jgi:hypothetical protein|nr:hypothetical protein [Bacteroidales bacterium]HPI31111.1 hypothetical protein [Bacteroidales bacterium]
MKHYQLTSNAFDGAVDLFFDDAGMLMKFDMTGASLSKKQQEWILRDMYPELNELKRQLSESGTAKITEVTTEVTFEMFWDRYDDKINSSRKRTLQKWNRMTKTDQLRAYTYINRYLNNLPSGTRKKYAETYLNSELWNN